MRAIRWATAAAVLGALALPGTAAAGGFATVGLSSLPDGTPPGGTWHVTLTILQHGRTPLSDLAPVVRIRSGTTARAYTARPAGRPGAYTADVVFPSAGRWRYAIDDGFTQTHTFAPVAIGRVASGPATRDTGAEIGLAVAVAAVAGLLAAFLAGGRVLVPLGAAAAAFAIVAVATRGSDPPARAAAPAAPAPGRAVFARMGCGGCHTLKAAGSSGVIGPSLDVALAHHTPGSLKAKITRPGTASIMPQDFARRMDATELAALVDFLVAARDGR